MWFIYCVLLVPCLGLLALIYLGYFQPSWFMRMLQGAFPRILWSFDTSGVKCAALTIDDAPMEHIEDILDALLENKTRATFFVIGSYASTEKGKRALDRMLDEGHEIAHHTWSNFPSAILSLFTPALFKLDFEATDALLQAHIEEYHAKRGVSVGQDVQTEISWFRPSHGFFTPGMLTEVEDHGYSCVLGDVYPHDPQLPFSWLSTWHVKRSIHPGAIVILHDRWHTATTLRSLLPELSLCGYKLDTIEHMVELYRRPAHAQELVD